MGRHTTYLRKGPGARHPVCLIDAFVARTRQTPVVLMNELSSSACEETSDADAIGFGASDLLQLSANMAITFVVEAIIEYKGSSKLTTSA